MVVASDLFGVLLVGNGDSPVISVVVGRGCSGVSWTASLCEFWTQI